MRKLLLKLHLYVALVAAAFVTVFGLTGAVMAFEPELDHLFNPSIFYVAPQQTRPLTIAALSDSVVKAFPGSTVGQVELPADANGSDVFGTDSAAVFVNGYTGAILGTRTDATILDNIHQLHIRLMFGQGKLVMSIAGDAMLFLVLTGIILWWKEKGFTVKWNGLSFRTMFDLHNAVGIYAFVFFLLISASGVFVAYDGSISSWLFKATGTQPIRRSMPSTPKDGLRAITAEQAIASAQSALPGAFPFAITIPTKPTDPYDLRVRFPEDRTPGGRSWVSVDQYSGAVLVSQSSRTAPGPTRAVIINRAMHTGDIFGIASKTVMSLSSLLVVVQVLTGLVMWLKRPKSS